jgi:hypothetical protein
MSIFLITGSAVGQLLLGAILGFLGRWVKIQIVTRRPAARIWAMDRARPIHIITSHDETDVHEFTVMVYPAEYLGAVEVRVMLSSVLKFRDVSVSTSRDFPMGLQMSDNIVCIGGPVNNRATKLVLERINSPVRFEGHTIVSNVSGRRYNAKVSYSDKRVIRDVGAVVMCRNPFRPKSSMTLLMGARSFGNSAAARLLTQRPLKRAQGILGKGEYRWAILDVDVVDDFVARIEVLESGGE